MDSKTHNQISEASDKSHPESADRRPGEANDVVQARKGRRLGLRIAALALGLMGALLIAEIGLRIAGFSYALYPEKIEFGMPDPQTLASDFEPDPDLFWVPPDYKSSTLPMLKKLHPKLVMMGCSCTQWGNHDKFLRRMVRKHQSGESLSVANVGVAGWSTYQGLQQLRRDILPNHPRVVSIYYGWNDHWIGFGIEDRQINEINGSILYHLLRYSRLAQLVSKVWVTRAHEAHDGPIRRVTPEQFRDNLREMVRLCRANEVVPVLLTAPTSHKRGNEPKHLARRHLKSLDNLVPLHQEYVQIVRDVAQEENVVLCDLAKSFEQLPHGVVKNQYFNADGIHLTPGGNRVLSEYIYETLRKNQLLELVTN
jgi:lysophospholipase L1-like esterase